MMKTIFMLTLSLFSLTAFCQVPEQPADTIIKKLDSLSKKADSTGVKEANIQKEAYNDITKLRVRDYFILLGSNTKQTFTKPFHMTRRDWGNLGKFAAVAVSVGFMDERIQKNALSLRKKSKFVQSTGKYISDAGGRNEVFTLAAFEIYGLIAKSQKVKTTTLLATQSLILGAIVETLVKTISGRTRPNYYADSTEAEPRFTGPFGNLSKGAGGKKSNSSFPSGHATAAFAVASVFAVEYKNKPIIPIVAYSIASLVSVSRITENKHWATDILTGAALGYLIGRRVAYNYHRLARIKNQQKAKASVSLNLQRADWGKLLPGIVVSF